jgi:predicted transglutaminase-like cysteine proteinase
MAHFPPLLILLAWLACCMPFSGLIVPARAEERPDPFERLFGHKASIARQNFPANIEQHWRRVLHAEHDSPCLLRNTSCLPPGDAPQWLKLAGKAPAMEELELLRAVNGFFNNFPFATDMENYGVEDRWPTMADFSSRRSGDCKAYAVTKYFALRALGVPDEKMRIVLVHLYRRKVNHAVLAVDTAKGVFILDGNARPKDLILPQERCGSMFTPLYMLNEKARWTFRPDKELLRAKYSR